MNTYTDALKAANKVRECLHQLDLALQDAARHTAIHELKVCRFNCDTMELEQITYQDDGKPFQLRASIEI